MTTTLELVDEPQAAEAPRRVSLSVPALAGLLLISALAPLAAGYWLTRPPGAGSVPLVSTAISKPAA